MLGIDIRSPKHPMSRSPNPVLLLLLALVAFQAGARDGAAIWDSRCEECHGGSAGFAAKYLWNMDGQLQGQHHVDTMDRFMRNHYIPDHEIPAIRQLLLSQANTPARFAAECGECHGEVEAFVEKSLWVGKNSISGTETGQDAGEFLPTHRGLSPDDADYFQKLFYRVAGKPAPSELVNKDPALEFK